MVCAAEMVPAMVLESAMASAKVAASGMLCVQLSSWLQLSSAGTVADADAITDGNTISGASADGGALVAMVPASASLYRLQNVGIEAVLQNRLGFFFFFLFIPPHLNKANTGRVFVDEDGRRHFH